MFYTKYLLLNKDEILEKGDIESDEFNDLLILRAKIDDLYHCGKLTIEEYAIINRAAKTKVFSTVKDGESLSHNFDLICTKLSVILGGVYTNSGYLSYMQKKYNLSSDDLEKFEKFLQNTRKFNI